MHCATPSSRRATRHRRTGSPSAGRWRPCSTSSRTAIRSARPRRATAEPVPAAELDRIIHACARHLLGSYARHDFIPCYAAFNLIGDPDFRGRDLLIALQGLNARAYKNSTLLFNLARAFIAGSPAAAVINPPWHGLAELIWSPVQIRHRSAYYDAFYAEALMDFLGSGLATRAGDRHRAPHGRTADRLLPQGKPRAGAEPDRPRPVRRRHRARAVAARAVQPLLRQHQERSRLRHLRAGLRHHRLLVLGGDAIRLAGRDPRPAADRLLRRLPDRPRRQPRDADGADQRQHRVRRRHRDLDREHGRRPALRQRPRSDAEPRRAGAVLPQLRALEDRRYTAAAGDDPQDHPFPAAAGRDRRVRRSALAHLLSAGAVLRLFRPLLCRAPRAAARATGRDRSGRQLRADPPPRHRLCPRRPAGGRDQRLRRGAGAARAGQARRRSEHLRAGAVLHRAIVRRGRLRARRTRPTSGTR